MNGHDFTLLGVDGGATAVKVHAVACEMTGSGQAFRLLAPTAERIYPRLATFTPVPVQTQFADRGTGRLPLTEPERQQGTMWVRAAADAIAEVAQTVGGDRPLLIGMGMPGLKTADGRGIEVINNGPRIPDFARQLEAAVAEHGCTLRTPLATLGSDADYCGLGEEYAAEGTFRDVQHAYYLGGGTGVADALKLNGQLVTFDAARTWLAKSWQMNSVLGATFEKIVSARALNEGYTRLYVAAGATPMEAFPEQAAAAGDPVARGWLRAVALSLAELIADRLVTVKNGRPDAPQRGETYTKLQTAHPYRGIVLERVVIGQRVGQIFANEQFADVLRRPVEACLAGLLAHTGDTELQAGWLTADRQLVSGRLVASRLRAAPALGAAVAAVQAFTTR